MKKLVSFISIICVLLLLVSVPNPSQAVEIKGNFSDLITKGPWIDSRAYTSLALANTAAYNAGKLLVIGQNYTLTGANTLTAHVMIIPGGSFTHTTGSTLALNGSFSNPSNGQCFIDFSNGDVTFGAGSAKIIPPTWWKTNTIPGTTDMTAAFNSAITAAGLTGELYIPIGNYLVTDSLSKVRNVHGENKWNSQIIFKPTTPGKILFDMSVDDITIQGYYWNPTIRNLSIRGGNAIDKTALRMWHVTEGTIDNVQVHFDTGCGDTSTGSIALNIMGCDVTIISNSTFRAARPILAENQPTSVRNNLDHVSFENMEFWNLIGSHPLVEFQIIAEQVKFQGKQVWCGGTSAFYSTGLDHSNLSFENIRWENGGITQTQHTFYIVGASTGTTPPASDTIVAIRDSRIGYATGYHGIYMRYLHMILFDNIQSSMSSTPVDHMYDVDGTNMHVTAINTNTAIGELDPLIGSDLKLVLSIGSAGFTSGVAYIRFYTSIKTFTGGYHGKPYVGLMDSLYWTYRGTMAQYAQVQVISEAITQIQYARIEVDVFDPADLDNNGSAIYTVLYDGSHATVINKVSADEHGTVNFTNFFLTANASIIYFQNNIATTFTVFIRAFYYPITPRN